MSTTIRVSEGTRERFAKISSATGRPMTQLLDEAADALERRIFFDELALGFAALRGHPEAWADVEEERAAESGTLGDRSE